MQTPLLKLGWREWCALPNLGIAVIKAKVDTGARTSALHTFRIDRFVENGIDCVRFFVHPLPRNETLVLECVAPVKDERMVSDSGGHREMRYIIESRVELGGRAWPIEMSLTNRDSMRFRMLLGRRALKGQAVVDPAASYLCGKCNAEALYRLKLKRS